MIDWMDIPAERYHADKAWGSSSARLFETSPKAAIAGIEPAPSSALSVGTLAHALVLEPARMGDIIEAPTKTFGVKAQKLQDENPDKIVACPQDLELARALADAVLSHDEASSLLFDCGMREMSAFYDLDGVRCKVRPDAMSNVVMLDLKTARDYDSFVRGYLRSYNKPARGLTQFGWYTSHPELHHMRCGFIVAVKEPAIDVGVIWLSDDAVKWGRSWASEIRHQIHAVETGGMEPIPEWSRAAQVYDPTDGLAPDLSITMGGVPIGDAF